MPAAASSERGDADYAAACPPRRRLRASRQGPRRVQGRAHACVPVLDPTRSPDPGDGRLPACDGKDNGGSGKNLTTAEAADVRALRCVRRREGVLPPARRRCSASPRPIRSLPFEVHRDGARSPVSEAVMPRSRQLPHQRRPVLSGPAPRRGRGRSRPGPPVGRPGRRSRGRRCRPRTRWVEDVLQDAGRSRTRRRGGRWAGRARRSGRGSRRRRRPLLGDPGGVGDAEVAEDGVVGLAEEDVGGLHVGVTRPRAWMRARARGEGGGPAGDGEPEARSPVLQHVADRAAGDPLQRDPALAGIGVEHAEHAGAGEGDGAAGLALERGAVLPAAPW